MVLLDISAVKSGFLANIEAQKEFLPKAYIKYSWDKNFPRNEEIGQKDNFITIRR